MPMSTAKPILEETTSSGENEPDTKTIGQPESGTGSATDKAGVGERTSNKSLQPHIEEKWMANYEKLKEFRGKHGHCNVSKATCDDDKLLHWVYNQKAYQRAGNLKQHRLDLLDQIGFKWSQKSHWKQMIDKLTDFKKKHGHAKVPLKYTQDPDLASWAEEQRKASEKGSLSKTRKDELEKLGLDVDNADLVVQKFPDGTIVAKEFEVDDGFQIFQGKVEKYELIDGIWYYLITYEDGDQEHMTEENVRAHAVRQIKKDNKATKKPTEKPTANSKAATDVAPEETQSNESKQLSTALDSRGKSSGQTDVNAVPSSPPRNESAIRMKEENQENPKEGKSQQAASSMAKQVDGKSAKSKSHHEKTSRAEVSGESTGQTKRSDDERSTKNPKANLKASRVSKVDKADGGNSQKSGKEKRLDVPSRESSAGKTSKTGKDMEHSETGKKAKQASGQPESKKRKVMDRQQNEDARKDQPSNTPGRHQDGQALTAVPRKQKRTNNTQVSELLDASQVLAIPKKKKQLNAENDWQREVSHTNEKTSAAEPALTNSPSDDHDVSIVTKKRKQTDELKADKSYSRSVTPSVDERSETGRDTIERSLHSFQQEQPMQQSRKRSRDEDRTIESDSESAPQRTHKPQEYPQPLPDGSKVISEQMFVIGTKISRVFIDLEQNEKKITCPGKVVDYIYLKDEKDWFYYVQYDDGDLEFLDEWEVKKFSSQAVQAQ